MQDAPESTEASLSLRRLLRPHAKWLLIGLAAALGESLLSVLEPWPLKLIFDHVNGARFVQQHLELLLGVSLASRRVLEFAAIAVVLIAAVGAACSYVSKYAVTSACQWITHDLRRLVYAHVQRLSLSFHTQRQTGDLVSRLTSDIDSIQSFIASSLLGLVVDTLTLLSMAAIMLYLDWRFTLIALSVAPLMYGLSRVFTRRSKAASRELRSKEAEIVSLLQEVLSAMGVVKAFGREEDELRRLEEKSLQSAQIAMRARSLKARLAPLVQIVAAAGTAMVLWYGGHQVLEGVLSAGSLVVFVWYLGKMYKPMQDFAKMADAYAKAAVGYERLREVLDTQPEVRDRADAIAAPSFKGEIEFEHVYFSYAPGRTILSDVNIRLAAGQMTALVGSTGSGKSTIASLIGRLYDPDSGVVRIDGFDLRDLRQSSIHDQVSYVLQDNMLFNASLAQNIAYGKPGATFAEIQRAAELAHAHEFIAQLPEGYETLVGEHGVKLSGGQRQRIAIARAIIRDSPILVMDEPSSGLDAASEELVFQAIERLIEGKTAVVIAHRLSTIRRAHKILVVQDGRISESGRHEELLAAGGLYARLHQLQFRETSAQAGASHQAEPPELARLCARASASLPVL